MRPTVFVITSLTIIIIIKLSVSTRPEPLEKSSSQAETLFNLKESAYETPRFFKDAISLYNTSVSFSIPLFSFTLPSFNSFDRQAISYVAFYSFSLLFFVGVIPSMLQRAGTAQNVGAGRNTNDFWFSLLNLASAAVWRNKLDCIEQAVCNAHQQPQRYGFLSVAVQILYPKEVISNIKFESLLETRKAYKCWLTRKFPILHRYSTCNEDRFLQNMHERFLATKKYAYTNGLDFAKRQPLYNFTMIHQSQDQENTGEGSRICVVCWGVESESNPLIRPCRCTGTLRFIHMDCLQTWITQFGKNKCPICQSAYQIQVKWKHWKEWKGPWQLNRYWFLTCMVPISVVLKLLDILLRILYPIYAAQPEKSNWKSFFVTTSLFSLFDAVVFWVMEWRQLPHNVLLDGFLIIYAHLLINYAILGEWDVVLVGTYGYTFLRLWQEVLPFWKRFRQMNSFLEIQEWNDNS